MEYIKGTVRPVLYYKFAFISRAINKSFIAEADHNRELGEYVAGPNWTISRLTEINSQVSLGDRRDREVDSLLFIARTVFAGFVRYVGEVLLADRSVAFIWNLTFRHRLIYFNIQSVNK